MRSTFPTDVLQFPAPIGSISSMGWEAASYGAPAAGFDGLANLTPGANKRFYIPFTINEELIVYALGWHNTTTVAGNISMSIYDLDGNLLLDTGSTAQSGSNVSQVVDTSDLTLKPGNYFLSISSNSTSGQLKGISLSAIGLEALGCKEQVSAFTAPNPATFADPTTAVFPWLVAFIRPVF